MHSWAMPRVLGTHTHTHIRYILLPRAHARANTRPRCLILYLGTQEIRRDGNAFVGRRADIVVAVVVDDDHNDDHDGR